MFLHSASFVKGRIICIEIAFAFIRFLSNRNCLAESLIMYDFSFTQEFYRLNNIRIIYKAQNIIVCQSRLLFCCKVLVQIRKHISGNLECACRKWHTGSCLRIYSCCMVNKVSVKSTALYFLRRQISCQLIKNGGYYFHVSKLFCTQRSIGNVP